MRSQKLKKVSEVKLTEDLFIQLLLVVILSSAVIFPFIFDSFVVPKLFILSIGLTIILLKMLKTKWGKFTKKIPRWLNFLVLMFISSLLISWKLSEVPFLRGAFGQFGRGNGLFYYFLAILTFVIATETVSKSSHLKAHQFVTYFSFFLGSYTFLQKFGVDIAKLDTRDLSPVVLTFGNSNFAGGMLAVLFTYHFVYLVLSNKIVKSQIALLLILFSATLFSAASQGYALIAFALLFGFSIKINLKTKSLLVKVSTALIWGSGLILTLLGLAGYSILSNFFSATTFQIRVEYWKISSRIIKDNFLFGVGPDKLFDVTSPYMSPGSIKLVTATRLDNAHNWYLNLAANYGVVAALLVTAILLVVFYAGFSLMRSGALLSVFPISAFAAFIALFIDGLVSIEQPGLGIWLYFFAGVVVGSWLEIRFEKTQQLLENKSQSNKSAPASQKVFLLVSISALIISSSNLTIRVAQDANLRSQIQKVAVNKATAETYERIIEVTKTLKAEPEYLVQSLSALAAIGDAKALDSVSKTFYEYYPKSIQATLIRADVLRALGENRSSCPMTNTLIVNSPWDEQLLQNYILCLAHGNRDPNFMRTLKNASLYITNYDVQSLIPQNASFRDLSTKFVSYSVIARMYFYLGKSEEATNGQKYARKLYEEVLEIEAQKQDEQSIQNLNEYLLLLDF
jgi:O-antigen ligase